MLLENSSEVGLTSYFLGFPSCSVARVRDASLDVWVIQAERVCALPQVKRLCPDTVPKLSTSIDAWSNMAGNSTWEMTPRPKT